MAWDPKIYLSYGAERTRPAGDLLARIPLEAPLRVADLGCGPGNSTALLRARWPEAEIDAIDSSVEMLREAHASGLDARLVEADIAQWTPKAAYDVIYSNAALQWLAQHETLFPRLLSFLRPGGVLAVQVPRNSDELCDRIIRQAASDPRWVSKMQGVRDFWNVRPPETYYDLLAEKTRSIDLWETRYFHMLEGEDAVFRWSMGTGLRPFASALDNPLKDEFLEQCRRLLRAAYPVRPNGKTIHRFLRLFLVAVAQ
jgi:trans-aconitate 2-methyltransferase